MLNELAEILLTGSEATQECAKRFGSPYEETKLVPWGWLSKVIRFGIVAGVTKELMRWLILNDFEDRSVVYEREKMSKYIDALDE
jgi:hypothetical protein